MKDQLKKLLSVKENDIILKKMKRGRGDFIHEVGITYCCHNTGWGGKDPGTLEELEKEIISSITPIEAVQLKLKYENCKKMMGGWQKHWINQQGIRITRFEHISKEIWKTVNLQLKTIPDINLYIEENFTKLTKKFKVQLRTILNQELTRDEVLEKLSNKELTVKESKSLLDKIIEDNADELCEFSGGSDGRAIRICSLTEDPKRRGDCGSCRVAAEWEMCYG